MKMPMYAIYLVSGISEGRESIDLCLCSGSINPARILRQRIKKKICNPVLNILVSVLEFIAK